MRLCIGLLVIGLGLVLANPVTAWHKDGHMAIARIAWQQLENDKDVKNKIIKILQAHIHPGATKDDPPIDHFKVFLSADRPSPKKGVEISEDEWAFARAAAWPDWVRDPETETKSLKGKPSAAITKAFHKGRWHFVNLPFAHPSDAKIFDEKKLADLTKSVLEPELGPPDKGNGPDEPRHAIAALKQSLKKLSDPNVSDADKAVHLCWVLHLVGDIHQPLHASALIARTESLPPTKFDPPPAAFDPPEGDAGGNRLAIKKKKELANAEVFHAYWDGLVFNDRQNFLEVEAMVQSLLRDKQYQPSNFPELESKTEFIDWANESLSLAKTVAYRVNGTADSDFLPAVALPIRKGFNAKKEAAMDLHGLDTHVLSPEYQDKATKTAEGRIVLAGYRLAKQLKAALQ